MKFPTIFHRSMSSRVSKDEDTSPSDLLSTPLHSSEHSYDHRVRHQDDLISVISAMQESENGLYNPTRKFTYHVNNIADPMQCQSITPLVDEECRTRMLTWCSNTVDYFDLDRSIVAVSVGYQDRFLNTNLGKPAQTNRAMFRLVSVTSLYIAIKLLVPHKWNITSHAFAQLCQGAVTGQEIADMEIKILFALEWNVNPPVPNQYAQEFLDLIFNSTRGQKSLSDQYVSHKELREDILHLIQYQLDLALYENRFFHVQASVITTASLLNALEGQVINDVSLRHGAGAAFCHDSYALVLDTMDMCRISSDQELERVRSILLSLVVSSPKDTGGACQYSVGADESSGAQRSHIQKNCTGETSSSPQHVSHVVSSSPISASKLFGTQSNGHSLTPKSVLSKVYAFHCI